MAPGRNFDKGQECWGLKSQLYNHGYYNINGGDVQRKNVVNNVDKSSLSKQSAPSVQLEYYPYSSKNRSVRLANNVLQSLLRMSFVHSK